jgi:hypothetical protein
LREFKPASAPSTDSLMDLQAKSHRGTKPRKPKADAAPAVVLAPWMRAGAEEDESADADGALEPVDCPLPREHTSTLLRFLLDVIRVLRAAGAAVMGGSARTA